MEGKHVAIVPDGNRRWAKERGLEFWQGYDKGAKVIDQMLDWCLVKYKVPCLSVYALSTENLDKRPEKEILKINEILEREFTRLADDPKVRKYRVNIRVLGDLDALSPDVREAATQAMEKTRNYGDHSVNFMMPYGGRGEILQAAQRMAEDAKNNGSQKVSEKDFEKYLYTAGLPDPDLVIRTGENRLSNFLLWQTAYSEIYFVKKYWPDFTPTDLESILLDFLGRERRFGE